MAMADAGGALVGDEPAELADHGSTTTESAPDTPPGTPQWEPEAEPEPEPEPAKGMARWRKNVKKAVTRSSIAGVAAAAAFEGESLTGGLTDAAIEAIVADALAEMVELVATNKVPYRYRYVARRDWTHPIWCIRAPGDETGGSLLHLP